MATLAATPTRSLSIPAHWRARIGYLALLGVLAYLVVLPMIRAAVAGVENGAQGYRSQYGRDHIAETLWTTLALAVGSPVISMVFLTLLAFAASRLPAEPGLWVTDRWLIVMPAIANIVGWAFLLSPVWPPSTYCSSLPRRYKRVGRPADPTCTRFRGSSCSPPSV